MNKAQEILHQLRKLKQEQTNHFNHEVVMDIQREMDKLIDDYDEECEHSFVDVNNDGQSECRFCGEYE